MQYLFNDYHQHGDISTFVVANCTCCSDNRTGFDKITEICKLYCWLNYSIVTLGKNFIKSKLSSIFPLDHRPCILLLLVRFAVPEYFPDWNVILWFLQWPLSFLEYWFLNSRIDELKLINAVKDLSLSNFKLASKLYFTSSRLACPIHFPEIGTILSERLYELSFQQYSWG